MTRLFPQELQKDNYLVKKIIICLLLGILIRIVIIPFCAHIDLFSIYYRAHLLAYHKELKLPLIHQLLPHYIFAFFLWLFKPYMSYGEEIFPHQMSNYSEGETFLSSSGLWMSNISHPYIYRSLFFFKIPYLLFDIICSILLLHLLNNRQRFLGFVIWIFNPLSIFITYIVGKFEIIAILFILISLLFAKQKKPFYALFFLGISTTIRPYSLLFIIPYILILGKRNFERIKLFVFCLLPVIIISIYNYILNIKAGYTFPGVINKFLSSEIGALFFTRFCDYFLSMKFTLFWDTYIYIFIVFLIFIILHLFFNLPQDFSSLKKYCFIIILSFFSCCFFHPQYFMWIFPFIIFFICEVGKKGLILFGIQLFSLFFYNFLWQRPLWGYLFTPINPTYFYNLISPGEIIDLSFPLRKFIGIFTSIFVSVCLFQIYLSFKNIQKENEV